MKYPLLGLSCLTLGLGSHALQAQDQAAMCASLEQLELEATTIHSATQVAAGEFNSPPDSGRPASGEVPGFCRVELTVEPAVGMEIWLPSAQNWNGKYLAVGGGGLAGVFSYDAMLPAIQKHYVTSSTDTGHKADETDWLGDPELLRDYGYRAIHEMARTSKALISAYYNRQEEYAYFNGCSTGGRQGLMEAQRYPDDFDGIVSGAPVNYFTATHYTQLWISEAAKPGEKTLFPNQTLALITQAVLAQCDALDGVEDGLLEDPRQCDFKPASLQCENGASESCLSTEQVSALEKIYQGPLRNGTGEPLHYSLVPGGESPRGYPGSWMLVADNSPFFELPRLYFSKAVFQDPDWDWRSFNYGSDVDRALRMTGNILEATSPNLDAFANNGGKLILYHGWNDPVIFPEGTIAYYESIIDNLAMTEPEQAAEATAQFARLFMVPGMAHCRGGPGTDQFDMQAALETWVEQGQAPRTIEARHLDGGEVTRSRPLCPYPQTAQYDGSGDIDDAGNFSCTQ